MRPLILVAIVHVVVNGSSVKLCRQDLFVAGELGQLLDTSIKDLLEVLVDGSAALGVASDAQRPDGREQEHVVNHSDRLALVQLSSECRIVEFL